MSERDHIIQAHTGVVSARIAVVVGNHLAAELTPRPVLTELGATVPGRGLFVTDRHHDHPAAHVDWLAATGPTVQAFLRTRERIA
ncbi:hypothetical protein [Krasilnikovia sp. MM14-A1004]|uniref:hypothetical protein n=1 Tax=Krasilnikovia sp. MM14-A1004 TaxID=3373541 RepID=UPI00399CE9B1